MIKNLIKHSLRSFKRQKGYLAINILGLAIGIASSLLIATYVIHEASYDRFNEKRDRIYKLILDGKIGGQEVVVSYTSAPVGPTMMRDYPEVENFCRMNPFGSLVLNHEDQSFTEERFVEADSSFFNIFSVPLIYGDPNTVLNEPFKVVLSRSTALKMFGDLDIIGKTITLGTDSTLHTVSGVMEDIPSTSHFEANILRSFISNPRSENGIWLNNSFQTYILLHENSSPETVNAKMPKMIIDHVGPLIQQMFGASMEEFFETGNRYEMYLKPLLKLHFDTSIEQNEQVPATDPKYLIIFGSIAILIIIIAAINFMNLSTAQSSKRAKEVGVKKVGGSTRGSLATQFMMETILIAFIALILAIVLVKLAIPYFNEILGSNFSFRIFSEWYILPVLIIFTILVGLLSGSYPALYLSSISPMAVFGTEEGHRSGNGRLRSALVVFQFAASIILIIGTLIMYRQINHMLNRDLGFDKEQLIAISRAGALDTRVEAFKNRVRNIPGVVNIAASTAIPGRNNNQNGYMMEGRMDESLLMQTSWVDFDFLDTYRMEMSQGRFFDRSYPADTEGCIVNESMVREYQLEDPMSKVILSPQDLDGSFSHHPVLGVVSDFSFESLSRPVDPYIMRFRTEDLQFGYVSLRLEAENINQTIQEVEQVWQEFTTNDPMPYFFVDEDFERFVQQEKNSAQLAIIFAILAILVASLGLLGLTSFLLQQRTKEIGVRKAMGSSVGDIFTLISKNILLLITIAAVLGIPAIYFIANRWLQGYHFRITPGVLDLVSGYLIAIVIALVTISFRTLKAARISPAQSLKHQ